MKQLRHVMIGAAGGLLLAALIPLSGVLDLGAVPGGSSVADWMLQMSARQSVSLRSAETQVPPLDDPAMIQRGAGHYELVCAACHGSPADPAERFAETLSPKPPPLVEQMHHWRPPARVFWTVKHGIRRTAMPAWPTQLRDDEVWSVVAFLQKLPELSAEQYLELVGAPGANVCASCHGEDGHGKGGAFPRLDIQSPAYLAAALTAFRHGTRASGTMMSAASGLTDRAIAELAAYYGKLTPVPAGPAGRGAEIAQHGIPDRDVPACEACHGGSGRVEYPRLAGQRQDYIVQQLKLFAEHGTGRGGPFADIMAEVARNLSEEEMEAVAAWYAR